MEWQIHTWLLVGDCTKHPRCHICCSVASQLALGKPISTFICQLAAPLEMPWWKGISQPGMSLLVTFCDTFLLVCDAFTCSPSVSVSLSSCLPAVSLSKHAGFDFFPLFKRAPGTSSFKLRWSFLSQDQILLLIPVPHIFPWVLLASVIRIIWCWSQLITAARHKVARR